MTRNLTRRFSFLRTAAGFTLIELLVVVAIIGILMAIGMPSLRTLMDNQKMKSATFDLVTTVMQARSEAVKYGATAGAAISIVPSSASTGTASTAALKFTNGWCIVFTSSSACDVTSATPGGDVMRANAPVANVFYTVTSCPAVATAAAPCPTRSTSSCPITFGRNGRLTCGTSVKIQVTNDDPPGSLPRCVTIDAAGNASTKVGVCT